MIIRKAKIKDLPKLIKMNKKHFALHMKFDHFYYEPAGNLSKVARTFYRSYIYSPQAMFLVAEQGGNLVGFIIGFVSKRNKFFKRRWHGVLSEVYVEEKFRHQGIAKQLNKELFRWFKTKKVDFVEVWVDKHNKIAGVFYDKQGLETIHIVKYKKI